MDKKTGYKKTPLGTVPSNWNIVEILEVLEYEQPSKYLTNNINKVNNLNNMPVLTANKAFVLGYTEDQDGIYNPDNPVIIFDDFTTASRYIDFRFKIKSSAIKILIAKAGNDTKFLYERLQLVKINTEDHKRRWISEFQEIAIALPPINEQNEIAKLSFTWDRSIRYNEQLLENFINRRRALVLKLTSDIGMNVVLTPLAKGVIKVKTGFIPEKEIFYQEIGIRSHAKGIFHKEPVTGKSLGNKSVFWIEPDCFVVNIVFAWEQAIAKTTEAERGMIASHRFPMYKPKEGVLDLDYLLYFFKSAKGKNLLELASPGGAGRNKTLGQSEFLKLKIPVPPIEEQKEIVRLLNTADKEIELQKKKIEAIKQQKKGLMQQLLTGKKRLKINTI
ncbi:restriction endonuclease subunit S [Chitinophaga sp. 212800010-3]|uniref:restriction endonuclease subunit S n=1 Tax=unclassified Chitinophaga TaxID=2619133 RepID=UPI002DF4EC1C|nr:Restriction endonuclease subunit S [Chitinophaga sp. 212800010-3]